MDYIEMISKQRTFFHSGKTRPISWRLEQLRAMKLWLETHEAKIMEALKQDLNKSPFESYMTEIGIVNEEINFALKHLRKWSRNKRVRTPITNFPAKSFIVSEPYGVALIMSPWNYPFQLTLAPLIGAISAGNCAVVKPSAYSLHTSKLIQRMISELYPSNFVTVVSGGRKENEQLLEQRFDKIFFTGSISVGKTVMEKASRYLTPVSLELGCKSPCIVDETVNLKQTAKRIVWGKLLNSGQTCVAPDYILVHKSVKQELLRLMKDYIREGYGEDPLHNEELPKIINQKHFDRLLSLMDDGKIITGGQSNADSLKIAPTIIDDIDWNDPIMQEEIFGPLLPVLSYETLDEVVRLINVRPKPLALYCFTADRSREERILRDISFGGGCINDTIVHLATSYMPFGGVGESGMGGYHGKDSFDTFSHKKSILRKSRMIDVPLRYAPYKNKLNLLKKIF